MTRRKQTRQWWSTSYLQASLTRRAVHFEWRSKVFDLADDAQALACLVKNLLAFSRVKDRRHKPLFHVSLR
jgi:hypothetical protein